MHGGKRHSHGNGHSHDHDDHNHAHAGPGHNHPRDHRPTVQWQTPHLPAQSQTESRELDLDLVERAFVEGFAASSDPTSFLRLAHVPFEGTATDGKRLVLLRVESEAVADVGSVSPHVGGASFRYDVLSGRMVSRRDRLRLVYFDGAQVRSLSLAEAKGLDKP
jgi:hypothetical protein